MNEITKDSSLSNKLRFSLFSCRFKNLLGPFNTHLMRPTEAFNYPVEVKCNRDENSKPDLRFWTAILDIYQCHAFQRNSTILKQSCTHLIALMIGLITTILNLKLTGIANFDIQCSSVQFSVQIMVPFQLSIRFEFDRTSPDVILLSLQRFMKVFRL